MLLGTHILKRNNHEKISQQEARRLKKRVAELERIQADQRNHWKNDYPGGVHLGFVRLDNQGWFQGRIDATRMLGYVVVATPRENGELHLYGVK